MRQHWFRVGTVDVTTTVLITALATVSIFVYAIDPGLLEPLVFYSNGVAPGQVWRLLTWPLTNVPDIWVVLGIVMFYWFGQGLEQLLGRTRFLHFLVILTLVPAAGDTLFTVLTTHAVASLTTPLAIIGGITFLASGVVVAYAATYPTARAFYDIPFWALAAVMLGLSALQYTGTRSWDYLVFLLLMVLTALIGARSFGLSRLTWIPKLPLPAIVSGDRSRTEERQRRRKTKLRVVRDTEINRLLDKIAAHGIESLTREERHRLDEHSRNRAQ